MSDVRDAIERIEEACADGCVLLGVGRPAAGGLQAFHVSRLNATPMEQGVVVALLRHQLDEAERRLDEAMAAMGPAAQSRFRLGLVAGRVHGSKTQSGYTRVSMTDSTGDDHGTQNEHEPRA